MSRAVWAFADDPAMSSYLPHAVPHAVNHGVNRPLIARLNREWQVLNHRPAVLRRATGWGLQVPFANLDEILIATGFVPFGHDRVTGGAAPSADELLGRLLVVARTDEVAARVVLQRMLPGLINRAGRWSERRRGGSAEPFDELLSAAWTVIREFPVERRPHHLAANLLRDSESRAFSNATRRLLVLEPTAPHLLDACVEVARSEPDEELGEVLAAAAALSERDLLIIELLLRGCTQTEMARQLAVSERTVRNHRNAVMHRLRCAVMAA